MMKPKLAPAPAGELEALRARVARLEILTSRLQALLDNAPQGAIIHGELPLYCNDAAVRLFGYDSRAELLALPSVDLLFPPEARAELGRLRAARMRGLPAAPSYEVQGLRKDGTHLWLRISAQRVDWEGGPAIHCSYTDISDRMQAEQELRASRRLLRAVLDSLPHWVMVKDTQRRYLLGNQAMARAFGLTPETMQGRTSQEIGSTHPDEVALVEQTDRQVLQSGQPVDVPEYIARLPDGTQRLGHMIKVPLRDEQGGIIGLVGVSVDISRQRQAERNLRASEARLRSLVSHLPIVLATCDADGIITALDGRGLSALQRAQEQIVGRSLFELLACSPETQPPLRRAFAGEDVQGVWEYGGRTFEARLTNLRDEQGRVTQVICLALDITDRVGAERERLAGQRLLQNVVDTIPHLVFVKDRQSRYLLVNRAMAHRFGVPAEALLGRAPGDLPLATEEQKRQYREADEQVWATGRQVDTPSSHVTLGDGEVRALHTVKVPLRDESGAIVGLVGVAEDVTERELAQEELKSQRRLLQAVFDAIPAWLFVKDREGRFLMVNDTLARDVGTTPAAFLGMPHESAPQGTPEQRASIRRNDQSIIAVGEALEVEEEMLLPDGRLTLRHSRKVPLRNEHGEITGIVGLSEDVTERRRLEEQLRRMQRLEAIGTLAGGIAHDFNNILFPIIGFTELTMRELEPESRGHHNLSIVREAALRAKEIVAQILTFSRQSETKPEVMSVRPLVRESLRFLRSTLPRLVRIEEQVAPENLYVSADAVQLHQVLMNLCVNAAHAMPDGGTLTVGLRAVELQDFRGFAGERVTGPCVCLTVADTGVGMEPGTLARIFEPFFTTKPVGQGTGLGLSTALGIVSQHKGTIDVRSNPGQGSTFEVYLPAVAMPEHDAALPPDPASVRGDASILFVDDEWAVTELAISVLEELGYRVSGFTSSRAALQAFLADPAAYDLVITDQMMPDLTGDKLVHAIRAVREDIPVVLGTGFSEVVTPERARELGIDDVFHKPITAERLGALVHHALAERAATASPGAGA
jgi:PAS domain S-box-containing protein